MFLNRCVDNLFYFIFKTLSWSLVQFVKRAAAAEIPPPPQGQQRPATPNGHRSSVELEILKQLKEENDQIRERSYSLSILNPKSSELCSFYDEQ